MAAMRSGEALPAPSGGLQVEVITGAASEVWVLGLDSTDRVRRDSHVIRENRPGSLGVTLSPRSRGVVADIDLAQVPDDVEKVLFILCRDEATFGSISCPEIHVRGGAEPLTFAPQDVSSMRSLVLVEFYRRNGTWRLRAVGSGYSNGLEELETRYGVKPAPPEPAPTTTSGGGALVPVTTAAGSALELAVGQRLRLVQGGVPVQRTRVDLGWQTGLERRRTRDVDMDLAAISYAGRHAADVAYWGKTDSDDGSMRHKGDNLGGDARVDIESVVIDLTRIPASVDMVLVVAFSYEGRPLMELERLYCSIVDLVATVEMGRHTATAEIKSPHTAMVVARLKRADAVWEMEIIAETLMAREPVTAFNMLGEMYAA